MDRQGTLSGVEVTVVKARDYHRAWLLHFKGIETREDAETFARGWVADQGYQGSLADAIEEGMVQIEEWPSLDDFRG